MKRPIEEEEGTDDKSPNKKKKKLQKKCKCSCLLNHRFKKMVLMVDYSLEVE